MQINLMKFVEEEEDPLYLAKYLIRAFVASNIFFVIHSFVYPSS